MLVFKNPQRQWLAAAEQELANRLQEREILDNRIAELQAIINAIRPVLQNSEQTINMSVPQLCLQVLSSGNPQSPPEIRAALAARGIQINGPNPLAVIHTSLARLITNGYVEATSSRPGAPNQYRITATGRVILQGW